MHIRIAALGAVSLIALSSAAFAQDAPAEQEIVVTAQLREQNPIDVPISLTALSGDQLETLGVVELEDLGNFVPGLQVQNQSPNNPAISIRGITSDSGEAFNEPRVSLFQDGVSIAKSRGSYVELLDLERVEVAKGPQSTLYGRGALIGAINLISNKAAPGKTEGLIEGEYGNYDDWSIEGMVNLPIGDNAAIRVAGRVRKRDGNTESLLGGPAFSSTDTWAVRGSARLLAGEKVTIDLVGNYQEDHPTGTPFKSLNFNPTDPVTGAVSGDTGISSGAALAPGAGFENGRKLGVDRDVWSLTGIVNAELSDAFTLTSITGYRKFHALEIFDADGISLPILTAAEDARGKQTSQELRLTFDDKGPVTAFVGASYFHENGSERTPSQFDERELLARIAGALNGPPQLGRPASDPAPAAVFANTAFTGALLQGVAAAQGYALPAPLAQAIAANLKPNHQETSTNFAGTKSIDLFGDVTVKLSDRFEIGAGLRYSHDDKDASFTSAVQNGRSILGGFIGALGLPEPLRTGLLTALAAPGAATIPPSAAYPVPLFGLGLQPTAGNGSVETAGLKDDGFSWRLTARYIPNDDSSLYATYARGRRPEVLSALPPSVPFDPARFDPVAGETVDSYEIGGKAALLDRNLHLDGALYYYSYDNFQTTIQQGTVLATTNAGKAEAYGFEGQVRYSPSRDFSLFASYAYNHSRFKAGIRDGNRFRLSPDHMISLGGTVGGEVGPGKIAFTPTLSYRSKVFFDDDNDRPDLQTVPAKLVADTIQDEFQKGYALVNLRLGYTFDHPQISVEAFVDNVFDKAYIKDAGNIGDLIGLPTFISGDPRFYGVQAASNSKHGNTLAKPGLID